MGPRLGGPDGKGIELDPVTVGLNPVSLGINGTATFALGGTATPIKLRVALDPITLRPNLRLQFSMFGLNLWSISITGSADIGP